MTCCQYAAANVPRIRVSQRSKLLMTRSMKVTRPRDPVTDHGLHVVPDLTGCVNCTPAETRYLRRFYFAKYCDQRVSMSVCLSVSTYKVGQKLHTKLMVTILPNLDRFSEFFHWKIL